LRGAGVVGVGRAAVVDDVEGVTAEDGVVDAGPGSLVHATEPLATTAVSNAMRRTAAREVRR
jgi:hypothetical protein